MRNEKISKQLALRRDIKSRSFSQIYSKNNNPWEIYSITNT